MSKPICFVIMPFGKKPTDTGTNGLPLEINFDALWEKAIRPALIDLGYEPIRADQDIGALIIKEMLERLALADLVVADVTIPNANVYYEVGIRHAAKKSGCVLVAAEGSRQMFDIAQMPQLRYPLTEGEISDTTSEQIKAIYVEKIPTFTDGKSPVFQALPGFPDDIDISKTSAFQEFTEHLFTFQSKTKTIRLSPNKEIKKQLALDLLKEYPTSQPTVPAIAIELLYILRDHVNWEKMLDYAKALPKKIQELPVIKEQIYLAISKTGNHIEAIAALDTLISQYGDSSERRGLIGGRYKKLYLAEENEIEKEKFLDLAIENYEKGMHLDLNDYYPSCNLPRLYRTRDEAGDEDLARTAASIALAGTKRSLTIDPENEWLRPTMLAASFDTGNIIEAEMLYKQVRNGNLAEWKLSTTLDDLETSLNLHEEQETIDKLSEILQRLRTLQSRL